MDRKSRPRRFAQSGKEVVGRRYGRGMAGPDSIRGFNFQHAVALHATLDLLEDPGTDHIELEGKDDVIDFQVADSVGTPLRVAQVKSRSANVGPQELIDVIKRWKALGPAV